MSGKDYQGGKVRGLKISAQERELDTILEEFRSEADDATLESYKAKFMLYDVNQSGDIDFYELQQMMEKLGQAKTHLELKKMITEIDTTGKGTICFRDFCNMMLGKKSSILQKILMFESMTKKQEQPNTPPPKKTMAELLAK